LYEYLVTFLDASMLGHGAVIGYTGPGWAPLTISVWWRGRREWLSYRPVQLVCHSDYDCN